MRVGIGFTPFETRSGDVVALRLAVRADAAGVEAVGVAEGWTHDALVLLAEVAERTERIGVGTSVLSWSRGSLGGDDRAGRGRPAAPSRAVGSSLGHRRRQPAR